MLHITYEEDEREQESKGKDGNIVRGIEDAKEKRGQRIHIDA